MIYKTQLLLLITLLMAGTAASAAELKPSYDTKRLAEIRKMLREDARAPGWPISDRQAWERLAIDPNFATIPAAAEKLLTTPMPEQPDDLYLEYSRTGNRSNWQGVAEKRRIRLTIYVLAECIENKGRFLPALNDLISSICAERTWVPPAHDSSLMNFHGKGISIDLCSSAVAWNLAMTDWLLGSKLCPDVLQELRSKVRSRVIQPYLDTIRGKRPPEFWVRAPHNWNPVCLTGVTGAGLIELDSPDERAELIAAAEANSNYFLSGFTPDGYCSEGLGYWCYGFGHFAVLSELLKFATDGGIDLLSLPQARNPAMFGSRIELANGISPAFADCGVNQRPTGALMWLLNRRLGLGMERYRELTGIGSLGVSTTGGGYLGGGMVCAQVAAELPGGLLSAQGGDVRSGVLGGSETIRSWFEDAGVLICRPMRGSESTMAVALKGGHNAEHHNHNDLGSIVMVCGGKHMLLDPGNEVYTARTFSKQRYESKLLNSYGHSVPVVAGKLQREGAQARAKVLRATFSDNSDLLRLDIASAYDCPELKKLERRFLYSRVGSGSLTVTDEVEFETPQSFGTALITTCEVKQLDDKALLLTNGGEKLRIVVDCGGLPFSIKLEQIIENSPIKPTRICIELNAPVTSAIVTAKISRP